MFAPVTHRPTAAKITLFASSFSDLYRHPTHFYQLIERNGRRTTRTHRFDKRIGTCYMPFVLAPLADSAETRPAPTSQHTEVVQLQHPPGTESLDPFFRKPLVSVRKIVDRADGPVREGKSDRCFVILYKNTIT